MISTENRVPKYMTWSCYTITGPVMYLAEIYISLYKKNMSFLIYEKLREGWEIIEEILDINNQTTEWKFIVSLSHK